MTVPRNASLEHDSGVYLYECGVKDFNSVGPDFVLCSVLPKIKMADKKLEATGKQAAHAG